MAELTSTEKDLLRAIIAELEVTEPISFEIKDRSGKKVSVDGVEEFFNADQIRAFYNVYARYVVGLYREKLALEQKLLDFQSIASRTKEFRKAPKSAISVDDV